MIAMSTIPLYRVRFCLWAIARGYPVAGCYCGRWHSPAMSGGHNA